MADSKDRKFPYPQCWSDDIRMDVLMAPFRLKSVNPENYSSKMNFWQEMIAIHCEFKGSPAFNKRELQQVFQRKDKVPYGLDNVIDEMRSNGKIRLKAEYMYDPENSWTGWAINSFVKKPLWWGVTKVFPAKNDNDNSSIDYIYLDLVKKFCRDLSNAFQKHEGELFHYDALKTIIDDVMILNDDGIHICLHTLHYQKKVFIEYVTEDGEKRIHLIKIPGKSEQNSEITETDRAIHNLKMTQKDLMKQLETLEDDIKDMDEKARLYVKDNKRQLAKTYLRKKHLLEKNHERRSVALNNVETLLSNVDEAQSNGAILDAYKIGSRALQKVLNDSGLKYENVDEVICDIRETIEDHNEIRESIANANIVDKFDDTELELELKEILGEKTDNANETPKVPVNYDPNAQKSAYTDAELLAMLEGLEVHDDHLSIDEMANITSTS